MPVHLELSGRCGASCDFRLEENEGKVRVFGHGVGVDLMVAPIGQETLDQLRSLLGERTHTGYDILRALPDGANIACVILLLKSLWEHGLIDQIDD